MERIRYMHLKEGKIYDFRCALNIKNKLKKYKCMQLVLEKQTEPDKWKLFTVGNYLRMNFHRGDIMVLYAYGEDTSEEERVLHEICDNL